MAVTASELRNIGPLARADLAPEERVLMERLDAFEAPYLQVKLLEKGVFASPDE